jgi:tetratricopeptide (TPR) repeat protein
MSDHKTRERDDSSLATLLSSKEVLLRLLRGSEPCQPAVHRGLISLETAARGEMEAPELSSSYDDVLDRAIEYVRRAAALPKDELLRFQRATSVLRSGGGVLALTGIGGMSVEGLGVFEALLARSWAIRYDNPREMCHLARVAAEMSEAFLPEIYGAQQVADLRARAWGEAANAYRVANRLREAQDAFGKAFGFLCQGSGDRGLKMRLFDLEASFLGTSREFALALQRLTTLAEMYWADGDIHLSGRALITKALYTFYRGDTEEACKTIEEGLALIDRDRDPSLALVATFDYLLFLVDGHRFREAKRALFENRGQFVTQGNVASLKLRWIEGRISYGLRELGSAEIAFREAKQGLAEAGMGFACGIAGLDLAMTLLRQERQEEAIQEGLESAEMFRAVGVHREFLGTAVLLEEAFRAQTLDLGLLEASAQYLRKKMMELGKG